MKIDDVIVIYVCCGLTSVSKGVQCSHYLSPCHPEQMGRRIVGKR